MSRSTTAATPHHPAAGEPRTPSSWATARAPTARAVAKRRPARCRTRRTTAGATARGTRTRTPRRGCSWAAAAAKTKALLRKEKLATATMATSVAATAPVAPTSRARFDTPRISCYADRVRGVVTAGEKLCRTPCSCEDSPSSIAGWRSISAGDAVARSATRKRTATTREHQRVLAERSPPPRVSATSGRAAGRSTHAAMPLRPTSRHARARVCHAGRRSARGRPKRAGGSRFKRAALGSGHSAPRAAAMLARAVKSVAAHARSVEVAAAARPATRPWKRRAHEPSSAGSRWCAANRSSCWLRR